MPRPSKIGGKRDISIKNIRGRESCRPSTKGGKSAGVDKELRNYWEVQKRQELVGGKQKHLPKGRRTSTREMGNKEETVTSYRATEEEPKKSGSRPGTLMANHEGEKNEPTW